MTLTVRAMTRAEVGLIIDYFHDATPEHLEMLGVDPTRLPGRAAWQEPFQRELARPVEQRSIVAVIWLLDDRPVGFSTADTIVFGERANMHLHVVDPAQRNCSIGTECVRQSIELYFATLRLKRLFCEPNAFNTASLRVHSR